eukprot:CAMPEP_0117433828 /NCGR_PEP_ID=MMETSP0758-20121206/13110_1 /TAXON_ID=63605 /ORGANISM="Percolomonas cosmopolitus, Strain AE-1 (ATCC 50343)" /LENGTH=160 /DNA_ID=CAMNT_0005224723 /DNA_START=81 /DNA_END=560 /DNA_ORIENTATION=+
MNCIDGELDSKFGFYGYLYLLKDSLPTQILPNMRNVFACGRNFDPSTLSPNVHYTHLKDRSVLESLDKVMEVITSRYERFVENAPPSRDLTSTFMDTIQKIVLSFFDELTNGSVTPDYACHHGGSPNLTLSALDDALFHIRLENVSLLGDMVNTLSIQFY